MLSGKPEPADDIRYDRPDWPGHFEATCGNCGAVFGSNCGEDDITCPECEAQRCPHCRTWFGGES